LVTGVTGAGKSTTIAAMLDRVNKRERKHIISIEDPIEYVHRSKKSLFSQRAIGINTHSFTNGLRSALREDLDIIFIGELRDYESVEIALHAANTGHLVVSTLHTLDAKETISRIVGMFPNEEQDRIRMTLAFVLKGVISQRLVKRKDGGRIPAVEVMRSTKLISDLILDKRDNEILEAIERGKEIYGTQSFDQSLLDLLNKGKITEEEVLKYATNSSDTNLKLQGISEFADYKSITQSGYESTKDFIDLKK
jgi:twitching motility protein PilT